MGEGADCQEVFTPALSEGLSSWVRRQRVGGEMLGVRGRKDLTMQASWADYEAAGALGRCGVKEWGPVSARPSGA